MKLIARKLRRGRWAGPLALLLTGLLTSSLQAEPPLMEPSEVLSEDFQDGDILQIQFQQARANNNARAWATGTSSDEAKRAAIQALPLNKLTPADRNRVAEVVNSSSMFRRMPTIVFESDPDAYEFMVYHPDVTASIWRAMKISKMRLWQTGRFEFEGDAEDGTIGTMDVVFQSPNLNLVFCEGEFKSPLIPKPIRAQSVILLRTGYSKEANDKIYITHSADLYVSFPSQTVDNIAKILSPISGRIADRTFSEISTFLKMMSMAMTTRPGWVEKLSGKMGGIPDLRRTQLLKLTAKVYAAELKRQDQAGATTVSGQSPARDSNTVRRTTRRSNPLPLRAPRR
ncbi:hypothetical protein Pan258_41580 [Symmachiella dynata]|uniref:hypothetical protein n=1 Tax=Symmachiella dynata TaxID=2527995 RepID=UPI00118B5F71|nr:hypothetical protein [Symmachiella dynata]QDT50102.1 hypothetical protein Pan258_41580 [Symmachiella dynata]